MATTVNKSPSGVQTRYTRHSRAPHLEDDPQIVTRNSTTRSQASEHPNDAMMSTANKAPGNASYLRPRRALEHLHSTYETCDYRENNDDVMSYQNEEDVTLMDNQCDMVINGENGGLDMDNIGTEDNSKGRSGKQLKTMVNRLAPTPGFVDKNSLPVPSDLMTRNRVRRVASLNAGAKVSLFFKPSSPLAGRSMTDITTHSKKVHEEDEYEDFMDEDYTVKPRGRPRLACISTNNSNFLRSPELLNEAAHVFHENTHELHSENSVTVKNLHDSSASLKRFQDADEELYEVKRPKLDGGFMRHKYEQNGDYNTIITDRRIVKGKEVVDVGLQVKIPKNKLGKNHDSIQCTCRSSTLMDIPVKSYVSTYANGTLVSIPITKTHRLTPQVPEKPLPELAQGDLANRSKRVAGLNSRAMLNAILSDERQLPTVQNVTKPARKLQQKKSYYEHGLSNTVPSKLKIPKITFAATSTSNFGGRKMVGNQKASLWSKSGLVSHDGPKRTNGWFYLGSPIIKPYHYNDAKVMRKYYIGIKRNDEVIYVRDSVLLKSGPRRKDLPFVARVSGFWEEDDGPHAGEMMMSVLWYYRPEQTEMGMQPHIHGENEILASRHKDDNSVACIVDKCYVLSYPEYCRHRAATKRSQDSRISSATPVPPVEATYTTREHIPSTCDPKLLFFCRQIYDYRMGRILKNPLYI